MLMILTALVLEEKTFVAQFNLDYEFGTWKVKSEMIVLVNQEVILVQSPDPPAAL